MKSLVRGRGRAVKVIKYTILGVVEYVLIGKIFGCGVLSDCGIIRQKAEEVEAEPEWVGVYIIEIMTQEAEPDRLKWKDEVDDLGIYIPVRECAGSNLAICRDRGF